MLKHSFSQHILIIINICTLFIYFEKNSSLNLGFYVSSNERIIIFHKIFWYIESKLILCVYPSSQGMKKMRSLRNALTQIRIFYMLYFWQKIIKKEHIINIRFI